MKIKAFVVLFVISLKSLGLFAQPCKEIIDYSPNKLVEAQNLDDVKKSTTDLSISKDNDKQYFGRDASLRQ